VDTKRAAGAGQKPSAFENEGGPAHGLKVQNAQAETGVPKMIGKKMYKAFAGSGTFRSCNDVGRGIADSE